MFSCHGTYPCQKSLLSFLSQYDVWQKKEGLGVSVAVNPHNSSCVTMSKSYHLSTVCFLMYKRMKLHTAIQHIILWTEELLWLTEGCWWARLFWPGALRLRGTEWVKKEVTRDLATSADLWPEAPIPEATSWDPLGKRISQMNCPSNCRIESQACSKGEEVVLGAVEAILLPWGESQEHWGEADPELWHCWATDLTLQVTANF